MADDNRPLKYLRYSIGEVILVVVGILIALQINTWNENRKAKLQEVKILKQLRSDLISNLTEVTEIEVQVKKRLRYSDSASLYFKERRKLDDSLVMYIGGIRNSGIFNSSNTAYKYIQSEGMNILSNDSVRADLTVMYERHFRNIDVRSIGEENIQNNVLEPFIRKHFKPIDANIREDIYVKPIVAPIDIEALYENFEFQSILLEHSSYLKIRIMWLEEALSELATLIQEVESEIGLLES
jgi:hypothetical protein